MSLNLPRTRVPPFAVPKTQSGFLRRARQSASRNDCVPRVHDAWILSSCFLHGNDKMIQRLVSNSIDTRCPCGGFWGTPVTMKIKSAVITGFVALGIVGQITGQYGTDTGSSPWGEQRPHAPIMTPVPIEGPPWLIHGGNDTTSPEGPMQRPSWLAHPVGTIIENPTAQDGLRVALTVNVTGGPKDNVWICTGSFAPVSGACAMTLPNPNIGPSANWTFENAQLWYPRNGVCSTLGIPFYETIWMGKSQASAILVATIHVEPSLINEEDCFWMFNGRTHA